MSDTNDIFGINWRRVAFGVTTSSYGITMQPGQVAVALKLISGGTLELVHGATPAPTGLGWPLGNEVLSMDLRHNFYVCASGATCVLAIGQAKDAGFTDV